MLNLPPFSELALPYSHSTEAFAADVGDSRGSPQQGGADGGTVAERSTRILLIGDDPTLQYTRCKLLESAGYAVKSARSSVVVEELFLGEIDLVLLCHTVPENVARHIVSAFARLAPQIRVLRISFLSNPRGERGQTAFVQSRPAELLDAIAATLTSH